jgi:hypothetical protein
MFKLFSKFIPFLKRVFRMNKQEIIASQKAAFAQAQDAALTQVLGDTVDQAIAGAPQGFTQADIDAAVKAAQSGDQAAFDAAKAESDRAMADLQAKFDDLSKKEGVESGVIQGLEGSLSALQSAVATLAGLVPASQPAQPSS